MSIKPMTIFDNGTESEVVAVKTNVSTVSKKVDTTLKFFYFFFDLRFSSSKKVFISLYNPFPAW